MTRVKTIVTLDLTCDLTRPGLILLCQCDIYGGWAYSRSGQKGKVVPVL